MNRLFGTAKPVVKPTLNDATSSMDKTEENIDTKLSKLDKELARYTEQTKKMKPGPAKQQVQKRAMALLKQKKMYEAQKGRIMDQKFNVEQIQFAQDGLKNTIDTAKAMKDATKDLKKQMKQVNIDQVEDMQDDMADMLEEADAIQDALGRSYNTEDVDEADLEAELAAMEEDPSLFFESQDEGQGEADYLGLELPAASTEMNSLSDQTAESQPQGMPAVA